MQTSADLSKQIKSHFDNRDFEALMRVINEALKRGHGQVETEAELKLAEPSPEDEKLREEFEIHVENLKNEAMKQFDQELYGECLGTFRFLCELEPENRTLRDYLQLCWQFVAEAKEKAFADQQAKALTDGNGNTILSPANVSSTALPSEEPGLTGGNSSRSCEAIQGREALRPAGPGRSRMESEPCVSGDLNFSPRPDSSRFPPKASSERNGENQERQGTDLQHFSEQKKDLSAQSHVMDLDREPRQQPVPARKSVRAASKFAIMGVTILLVSIIAKAYLKGPGGSRHSQVEQRTVEGLARETSRPEEAANRAVPQDLLFLKAKSAAALGHYVSPPSDNAVAYCNRILEVAPGDPKAYKLKQASVNEALGQARKSITKRQFTEAREIYSSLLQVSEQRPDQFLFTSQQLTGELEKLEFTDYSVAHDHLFGSCKGHLRFNAYVISFVPSGNSGDDFVEPLTQVTLFPPGNSLKIHVRAKTYHFQSDLGGKDSKRENLKSIFEDVKRRTEQGKASGLSGKEKL